MIVRRVQVHVGRPWIMLCSLSIHYAIGITLILNSYNQQILALAGLNSFSNFFNMSAEQMGATLIVLSTLALWGICSEKKFPLLVCALLVLPQYSVMLWSMVSDVTAMLPHHQTTTTGSLVDRTTVIAVLADITFVAFWHTVAFIERYAWWRA